MLSASWSRAVWIEGTRRQADPRGPAVAVARSLGRAALLAEHALHDLVALDRRTSSICGLFIVKLARYREREAIVRAASAARWYLTRIGAGDESHERHSAETAAAPAQLDGGGATGPARAQRAAAGAGLSRSERPSHAPQWYFRGLHDQGARP